MSVPIAPAMIEPAGSVKRVCGELLIFHRNQQFATHTGALQEQFLFELDRFVTAQARTHIDLGGGFEIGVPILER